MKKKPHKHHSRSKTCLIPDNGFRRLIGLGGQEDNEKVNEKLRTKNNKNKHTKLK